MQLSDKRYNQLIQREAMLEDLVDVLASMEDPNSNPLINTRVIDTIASRFVYRQESRAQKSAEEEQQAASPATLAEMIKSIQQRVMIDYTKPLHVLSAKEALPQAEARRMQEQGATFGREYHCTQHCIVVGTIRANTHCTFSRDNVLYADTQHDPFSGSDRFMTSQLASGSVVRCDRDNPNLYVYAINFIDNDEPDKSAVESASTLNYRLRVIDYANHSALSPNDKRYNNGLRDCRIGEIYSSDAKYFLECSNFSNLICSLYTLKHDK